MEFLNDRAANKQDMTEMANSTNSVPTEPSFLDTPQGRRLAYHRLHGELPGVVYIHGLNSSMHGEKCSALERYCRSKGRAFLRFDLSGHGQSSESLQDCTVTGWLEDVSAVIQRLAEGPQVNYSCRDAWLASPPKHCV